LHKGKIEEEKSGKIVTKDGAGVILQTKIDRMGMKRMKRGRRKHG
jgi:hypothetical protein